MTQKCKFEASCHDVIIDLFTFQTQILVKPVLVSLEIALNTTRISDSEEIIKKKSKSEAECLY